MKKICKRCQVEKDIADFYVHKQMEDGYLNFCKECVKKRVHKRYVGNLDESRRKEKERYERRKHNPKYIACKRAIEKRYYQRTGLPRNIARRLRKLKPDRCEMCGILQTDLSWTLNCHHEDNTKPYSVKWLCSACHYKVHHPQFF